MDPYRRRTGRAKRLKLSVLMLCLLLIASGCNYFRPLPVASAHLTPLTSELSVATLAWPASGQTAVGAVGYGMLDTHGGQSPMPTASLAKIITGLAILQKKPLQPGSNGPTITLGEHDIELYNAYFKGGSALLPVIKGEKITEYQALQGMILASANNVADSLAIWAFGSLDAYTRYANNMVRSMGLDHTTVATDASGFSPNTKSTSADLVRLGEAALQHPVLGTILTQKSAKLPVAGTVYNINGVVDSLSIIGLKTGSTDQAPGCFLFAAKTTQGGKKITIVGALLGAPNVITAIKQASVLAASAKANFETKTLVKANQPLGNLTTKWGATAPITARQDVTIVAWKGIPATPKLSLQPLHGAVQAGDSVGTITASSGTSHVSSPVIATKSTVAPTLWWRLARL
ncbi:MAG TPA: hypothetical protein VMY99_02940 [Nevskiaceae bacterium]|nr:hypothetical protein [Nevskiaceae bacterium]